MKKVMVIFKKQLPSYISKIMILKMVGTTMMEDWI